MKVFRILSGLMIFFISCSISCTILESAAAMTATTHSCHEKQSSSAPMKMQNCCEQRAIIAKSSAIQMVFSAVANLEPATLPETMFAVLQVSRIFHPPPDTGTHLALLSILRV